ncbi:hypothetical protein COMNV_01085 [Commensalibacter sp. Nvir]|uniref:hypothetical protein n=1 Tax=Commensalibacter sp. Nvir TaxID=3069817 RepID=UPI002D746528|nr:hypothetical protein COMNV_01085 [Commensalibacter sp. Nvir]
MRKHDQDDNFKDSYEYDLPKISSDHSDESLAKGFFTHPSQFSEPVEPFSVKEVNSLKPFKKWLIACVIMIVCGLIFEFGVLGQKGKEGWLCKYLPKNKVCFYLAGPAPFNTVKTR